MAEMKRGAAREEVEKHYRTNDPKYIRPPGQQRRRQIENWLKSIFAGIDIRILLIKDKKCQRWILNLGEREIECVSGNHQISAKKEPGTDEISVAGEIYFRCEKDPKDDKSVGETCGSLTRVRALDDIGYFVCLTCYWTPHFDQKVSLNLKSYVEEYQGLPIELNGSINLSTKQIKNGLKVLNLPANVPHRPNNGLSIGEHLLKSYIQGKVGLSIYLVRCITCDIYVEFLWSDSTYCITCDQTFDTTNVIDRDEGEFVRGRLELELRCKQCRIPTYAPEWALYTTRKCPYCPYIITTDTVTFERVVIREEENYFLRNFRYTDIEFEYILRKSGEAQLNSSQPQQSSSRSTTALILKQPSLPSSVTECLKPSEDHDRLEYHVKPRVPEEGEEDVEFDSWTASSSSCIPSTIPSYIPRWFALKDKVVAIDVEFMSTSITGIYTLTPFVISAFGLRQDETTGPIIENQFIYSEKGFHTDFYSLAINGITYANYRNADKIKRNDLIELLKKHFANRLVIHHGPNDLLSLGIGRGNVSSSDFNCIFLDTTTIFTQEYEAISISRLSKAILDKEQPSPHEALKDTEILYDIYYKTVIEQDTHKPQLPFCPKKTAKEKEIKLAVKCPCHLIRRCRCDCKKKYGNFMNKCKCNECKCYERIVRKEFKPTVLTKREYMKLKGELNGEE